MAARLEGTPPPRCEASLTLLRNHAECFFFFVFRFCTDFGGGALAILPRARSKASPVNSRPTVPRCSRCGVPHLSLSPHSLCMRAEVRIGSEADLAEYRHRRPVHPRKQTSAAQRELVSFVPKTDIEIGKWPQL
jgi:hypothetical protein